MVHGDVGAEIWTEEVVDGGLCLQWGREVFNKFSVVISKVRPGEVLGVWYSLQSRLHLLAVTHETANHTYKVP
jgi:hypothetical protein